MAPLVVPPWIRYCENTYFVPLGSATVKTRILSVCLVCTKTTKWTAQSNSCKVIHESVESVPREDTGFSEFFLKRTEFMNLKRMPHRYWLGHRRCRCQWLSINSSLKHGFNVREKSTLPRVVLFVMPLQFSRNAVRTYRILVCWKSSFCQTFLFDRLWIRLCSLVTFPWLSTLEEFKTSGGICLK